MDTAFVARAFLPVLLLVLAAGLRADAAVATDVAAPPARPLPSVPGETDGIAPALQQHEALLSDPLIEAESPNSLPKSRRGVSCPEQLLPAPSSLQTLGGTLCLTRRLHGAARNPHLLL